MKFGKKPVWKVLPSGLPHERAVRAQIGAALRKHSRKPKKFKIRKQDRK